jgi:hypothetical protein
LIDDLWALGLANLDIVHTYDTKAAQCASLNGRNLEPWRAILDVALWLTNEHGITGLFDRMEQLSVAYQAERSNLEANDPTRLLILALKEMTTRCTDSPCHDLDCSHSKYIALESTFTTSDLKDAMNCMAQEHEIIGEDFTPQRVGRLLKGLRIEKAPRTAQHKRWKVTRDRLMALEHAYGMTFEGSPVPSPMSPSPLGRNGTNGNMAQGSGDSPLPHSNMA